AIPARKSPVTSFDAGSLGKRLTLAQNGQPVGPTEPRERYLLLSSRAKTLTGVCMVLLAAGCGKTPSASARPKAAALSVRVAPVVDQEVVYRIKALGSLEAEEMVQVTAEVEGAVTDVRFHEGDRVTPASVLLRIDPERFRLEAEQAEASYN